MTQVQIHKKISKINPTLDTQKFKVSGEGLNIKLDLSKEELDRINVLKGDYGLCDNYNGMLQGTKYTNYIAVLNNSSEVEQENLVNVAELHQKYSIVASYLSLMKQIMTNEGLDTTNNSSDDDVSPNLLESFKENFYKGRYDFYVCGLTFRDFFDRAMNKTEDNYFLTYEDITYLLSKNLIPSIYARTLADTNNICNKDLFAYYLVWSHQIFIPFFDNKENWTDYEVELFTTKYPFVIELDILNYYALFKLSTRDNFVTCTFINHEVVSVLSIQDNKVFSDDVTFTHKYNKDTYNGHSRVIDYMGKVTTLLSNGLVSRRYSEGYIFNGIYLNRLIAKDLLFYNSKIEELELIKFIKTYYDNVTDEDIRLFYNLMKLNYSVFAQGDLFGIAYVQNEVYSFSSNIVRNSIPIDYEQFVLINSFLEDYGQEKYDEYIDSFDYGDDDDNFADPDLNVAERKKNNAITEAKNILENIFDNIDLSKYNTTYLSPNIESLNITQEFIRDYVPVDYEHFRNTNGSNWDRIIRDVSGFLKDVFKGLTFPFDLVVNWINMPGLTDIYEDIQGWVDEGIDWIVRESINFVKTLTELTVKIGNFIFNLVACLGSKITDFLKATMSLIRDTIDMITGAKKEEKYNFYKSIDHHIPTKIGYYYRKYYENELPEIIDTFDSIAYDIFYADKLDEDKYPDNYKKIDDFTHKITIYTSMTKQELNYTFIDLTNFRKHISDNYLVNFMKAHNDYYLYASILASNFYEQLFKTTLFAKEDIDNSSKIYLYYGVRVYPVNIIPKVISSNYLFDKIDDTTYKELKHINHKLPKYHSLVRIEFFKGKYKKKVIKDVLLDDKGYYYLKDMSDDTENIYEKVYISLDNYLIFKDINFNNNYDVIYDSNCKMISNRNMIAIKKTHIRSLVYSIPYKVYLSLTNPLKHILFSKYRNLEIDRDYLEDYIYRECESHCFEELLKEALGNNDLTQFLGNYLDRMTDPQHIGMYLMALATGGSTLLVASILDESLITMAEAYDYATDSEVFGDDYYNGVRIAQIVVSAYAMANASASKGTKLDTKKLIGDLVSETTGATGNYGLIYQGLKASFNVYVKNKQKHLQKDLDFSKEYGEYLSYDKKYEPDIYNQVKDYHYNQEFIDLTINEIGINDRLIDIDKRFKYNEINNHWINKRLLKYNN